MPSKPDDPQDPITTFLHRHQTRSEHEQRIIKQRERSRDYYQRIGRDRYDGRKPQHKHED